MTVRAAPNQVSNRLGDEVAILELDKGMYYGLNPVGAFIWHRLDEPVAVADLHQAIVAEYEVAEDAARNDLLKILDQLHVAGLVEVCDEAAA